MLDSKEKYYTNLSNAINNFNYKNNTPLSNVNIQETISKVMREDEEGEITDTNNVNADTFSHASSSKREKPNIIFTGKNLGKPYEIVDAVKNMTINDAVHELKTATASDAHDDITSNPDTVNHTRNQQLSSCRTIG